MTESLDAWYQKELDYFRSTAGEFAERFPKIANRLGLSGTEVRDPHVERLIQAFAYLNARTRHKLDDSFPELADAMLAILYPHMLSPVPSMSLMRFGLNPSQKDMTQGHLIPTKTSLETEPVYGHACQFRTCYPVQLFPMTLEDATYSSRPLPGPATPGKKDAEASLHLKLVSFDREQPFANFQLNSLRFFINVSNFQSAALLLESILTENVEVVLSDGDDRAEVLPPDCLRPVGFGRDDAILPQDPRTFPGYRLLTEYFVFPRKFLFFDVTGITPDKLKHLGSELHLILHQKTFHDELRRAVSKSTICMGCTPIINLYDRTADAISLNHRESEYRIVPDARAEAAHEVFTVNNVKVERANGVLEQFGRFYSADHTTSEDSGFWHMTRRPGPVEGDPGTLNRATEVYVTLVDQEFNPQRTGGSLMHSSLTCFNRDLPEELSKLKTARQIHLDLLGGRGPVSEMECLIAPTPTLRRHLGRRNLWPLISQLSLNHLSLMDSAEAMSAIREILILNDVKSSADTQNLIQGLIELKTGPCVQRVNGGFARGTLINLKFEDENFTGDSVFLFASVLNVFFGMYTTMNSFTKLQATTVSRELATKGNWTWPAQAGTRSLI